MPFPKLLKFKSDSTQAEFKNEETISKIVYGRYVYKNGFYFKGTEISFTMDKINELLRKEIITI